jgi:hypothetical protein
MPRRKVETLLKRMELAQSKRDETLLKGHSDECRRKEDALLDEEKLRKA